MTRLSNPHDTRGDVCIIGGGPAGLVLAASLAHHGRSVVLLESSAGTADPAAADLNQATTSGDPFGDLASTRARALGGTAAIWSTLRNGVVGGKYVPLDPIDLEPRDLTPWSGWPFGWDELAPWYAEAHRVAGLAPFVAAPPVGTPRHPLLPFAPAGLASTEYHWGRADRFTHTLPAALASSPGVSILRGATATALASTHDRAEITAVHWLGADGTTGIVHADRVVLAAGTIETTRLLLTHYREAGLTPPHWLGRGFMEHPIDRSLTLHTRHPAISPDPGFYAFAGRGDRAALVGRIGLSEKLMRAEQLRNASLRLFPVRHRFAARQLRRLSHRIGRTPSTTYRVLLDLEQAPHPDNRITLANQLDRLGRPRAHLHWEWRADDERFRVRLLETIRREFARSAIGTVVITAGPPLEASIHHHAGTARMHRDAEQGVVDPDLRLHDHANLFVASAAVFPTGGVANPTLTLLALALRLGHHLGGG